MDKIKILDFCGLRGLISDIKAYLLYKDIESITIVLPRRMALELLYMMDGMQYFGTKYEAAGIDYDVLDYDCYYLLEITNEGELILEPAEYYDTYTNEDNFKICISDVVYIYEDCKFRILNHVISDFGTIVFGIDA